MRPRRVDRILVGIVIAGWLAPLAARIAVGRAPPLPGAWAEMTSVVCLFPRATPTWNAFYVQVRTQPGGPWRTVDTEGAFDLRPFGNRDRLHRFLVQWPGRADAARDELAGWLAAWHRRRAPESPPWVEVRFLAATISVREDRPPSGEWKDPDLREVPANHVRLLSTHAIATQEEEHGS